VNEAFGDEPLRRERNLRAVEVPNHHPPEKHEVEQLAFAQPIGWNQWQRPSKMSYQRPSDGESQCEISPLMNP